MISGIQRVLARRIWFVPDLMVWGLPPLGEQDYLALDEIAGAGSVYYGSASLSQSDQKVLFSELTDHRGNTLPVALSAPRVFPRAKASRSGFVVGRESADGFRIARDPGATEPVTVDLLIVETGD